MARAYPDGPAPASVSCAALAGSAPRQPLAHLITARRVPGKRLRINITINKGLLRVADEAAEAAGLTRSSFIERALEVAIEA